MKSTDIDMTVVLYLKLEKLYSTEDRGRTERVTALPRSYMLNIDL